MDEKADPKVLQAAVRMICGCLADLSLDDQARALEQACVTLGLRVFVAQPDPGAFGMALVPAPPEAVPPYQEALVDRAPRAPLPMVQVEMRGDRPMVVNRSLGARPRPSMAVMDVQGGLVQKLLTGVQPSRAVRKTVVQDQPRGYNCRPSRTQQR